MAYSERLDEFLEDGALFLPSVGLSLGLLALLKSLVQRGLELGAQEGYLLLDQTATLLRQAAAHRHKQCTNNC